jgi:hypothetical protein
LIAATVASASERTLALEVVINGRPTGRVGEIIDRDGALYAMPAELTGLGFATGFEPLAHPDGICGPAGAIDRNGTSRVRFLMVCD